jgi:hypothetical protein
MQETVDKMVDYLNENFSEEFYVDFEEDEKNKVVFIQFLMDKVISIDNAIDFFSRINDSKTLCKKQEFELWKTKEEEPIIQISYIM